VAHLPARLSAAPVLPKDPVLTPNTLQARLSIDGQPNWRGHNHSMRKVVYTAVTDGYPLHPVINRRNAWDFVCFAESAVHGEGWQTFLINKNDIVVESKLIPNDKAKTTKRIKLLPHLFLHDYDISIWIDSSLQFKTEIDLDELVDGFLRSSSLMRVRQHPYRRCIYQEAEEVVRLGLDTWESVVGVIGPYRREHFPRNLGLVEPNFILRKHNAPPLIKFSNEWWVRVRDFSRRDQLSFNYVLWRTPIDVSFIDDRVSPGVELLSRGRDRGPFFNSTFNFFPTRGR